MSGNGLREVGLSSDPKVSDRSLYSYAAGVGAWKSGCLGSFTSQNPVPLSFNWMRSSSAAQKVLLATRNANSYQLSFKNSTGCGSSSLSGSFR